MATKMVIHVCISSRRLNLKMMAATHVKFRRASDGILSEIAVGAAASNCCVFSSQLSASIRLQQLKVAVYHACIQLYQLVLSQLHKIAVALSLAGCMPVELGLYSCKNMQVSV